MISSDERRAIKFQARREGKAVYYRNRAQQYRAQAVACRYRDAFKAADKLDRAAEADEAKERQLLDG